MNIRSISKAARRFFKKTALPAFLTAALALPLLPSVTAEASYGFGGDTEPFYQSSVEKLVGWDVLRGYPDGALIPENPITRAEFVAMVNRAYGYSDAGPTPFQDVNEGDWFAGDIAAAYTAGYFNGTGPTTASPHDNLTREQAMTILAKNMRLDEMAGEVTEFSDGRDFSGWSQGYVRSAAQKGLVAGYPDGSFRPGGNITRGEMATLLARALGTLVAGGGDRSLGDVYGNVTLNTPGTVLHDTTIAGDLYVSGGLGLQGMTLDNVRVLGTIIVAGGGEAQAGDSLLLRNTTADNLVVDSLADQYLSLRAEGNTQIDRTDVRSDAYIMDRTASGSGLKTIEFSPDNPSGVYTVAGNLENVVNRSPASSLTVGSGALRALTIDEDAVGALLRIDPNTAVRTLNLDTGTTVTGTGNVDRLNVNTAGSSTEMLPDTIDIRPGVVSTIAGEEMNTVQGQQSSDTPRILTGYPTTRAVATTTATGVFSCNKTGTLYWGVTLASDGSPTDRALRDPEGSSRLVSSGNLKVTEANKEVTANLTKLTAGSSYYLSAVLVDARGNHSTVKSWHFNAADNTVPNFASGYPKLTQNDYDRSSTETDKYYVQVAAVATKDCDLYWALYETGATAPTAADFRSGRLSGSVARGMEHVDRNEPYYAYVQGLKEQTGYIMYLWLNDADNAKSSSVRNVPVTTVDGTPPEFLYGSPTVDHSAITGNSIPMSVTMNENGTVYWVAVSSKAAATYLQSDAKNWWETAVRQIESGPNSVRKGSVTVRANTSANINVTGLSPATQYTIFFAGKDAAGNYAVFTKEETAKYMREANTRDGASPVVTQQFTHYNGSNTSEPYADTNIELIFSENIMYYPDYQNTREIVSLLDVYNSDKAKFAAILADMIKLYDESQEDGRAVKARTGDGEAGEDWVIDYRKAKVELNDDETLTVTFATDSDSSNSALNLSSGATYHFLIENVSDIASPTPNIMGRTQLDPFTTISAQVTLISRGSVTNIYPTEEDRAAGTNPIPIDMAFSLTPISTNVADNVNWDLLFWSDSSVKFQVYELTSGDNNTQGRIVRHRVGSDMADSDISITNDNGGVSSANPDSYEGFLGRSLFRDFYGVTNYFPSITGRGNRLTTPFSGVTNSGVSDESGTLVEAVPKYYGIHFTEVQHIPEGSDGSGRNTWNASVDFRISVVTGSDGLNYLSQEVTPANLNTVKTQQGVREIQTKIPFDLYKRFVNTTAPQLNSGRPEFTVADTSATMRVSLDRAGTLYYVVAPVDRTGEGGTGAYNPSVSTTLLLDEGSLVINSQTPVSAVENNIPASGDPADSSNISRFVETSLPTSNVIYNPTFGNDAIKTGSSSIGAGSYLDIEITELTPDKDYFVYLVTQGTGQVYSANPVVYRFRTMAVNRPKLYLVNNGASTVNVRSRNMDAVADYAVFLLTGLPTELSQPFADAIDTEKYTVSSGSGGSVEILDKSTGAKLGEFPAAYTVYNALANQDPTGGSLYDQFARESHKDALRLLITGATYHQGRIGGTSARQLRQDRIDAVNCTVYGIRPNQNYLFVASARSLQADESVSANSYGFGAYQPVYIIDDSAPKLVSLTGSAYYNPTNADHNFGSVTVKPKKISGTIYLSFDKDIYYYQDDVTRLNFNTGDTDTSTAVSCKKFQAMAGSSVTDSGTITVQEGIATGSANVNGMALTIKDASIGDYFLATTNLVSYYSAPDRGNQLRLTLRYDSAAQEAYIEVTPAAAWYPAGREALNTTVAAIPAENFNLSPTSISVPVGESRSLQVNFTPDGSVGTISWTIDSTNASLSDQTGSSVTVTGERVGSATITATMGSGAGAVTKECAITITEAPPTSVILTDFYSGTVYQRTGVIDVSAGKTVSLTVSSNVEIKNTTFAFTDGSGGTVNKASKSEPMSGVYLISSTGSGTGSEIIYMTVTVTNNSGASYSEMYQLRVTKT